MPFTKCIISSKESSDAAIMNDEFERKQMEAPAVYFKLLSQHLHGRS
jgi:hypothetical protein